MICRQDKLFHTDQQLKCGKTGSQLSHHAFVAKDDATKPFIPEIVRIIPLISGALPLIFLGLFYFYPVAGIFIRSFFDQSAFSYLSLLKILQSSRMAGIIWFTLWQALGATLLTLVVALPCAWFMGTFDFRGKKIIMTLATLPFVLPTIVVAAAFEALAASAKNLAYNNGILAAVLEKDSVIIHFANWLLSAIQPENSIAMILLAHIFYNFSVVLRITSSFWSSMGKDTRDAASMLGANRFQIFFKVTLPILRPAILASSILVFIFCFSSFGVILILGGPSFSTLEVEIYRQAAHLFNLPVASCLSLFQILFTFGMMWIYTLIQKRTAVFMPESEKFALKRVNSLKEKSALFFCVIFILTLCVLPIAALVINSFHYKGSISLIFYRELFLNSSGSIFYVPPLDAISNSFVFAFSTLGMALVVGVSAAYMIRQYSDGERSVNFSADCDNVFFDRTSKSTLIGHLRKTIVAVKPGKLLEPVFMLPLSTSAVTLGFGMIITLDKPPLNLRTSLVLIPIVHTLVAFPFVLRAVLPALRSIPSSLKEAAAVLGASPFRVWLHIELPIIARALTIGAVFAFTISLGEFGATLFAARPEFTTIPVTIYKFLGQPGAMNYGQAMAMSSILMLVTAAGFLFIENIRRFGHEGF